MEKKKNLIYILGAGRSGSTLLATILNDSKRIQSVGELDQFFTYLKNDDLCSCGASFSSCEYWGKVKNSIADEVKTKVDSYIELSRKMEYHTAIPHYLINRTPKGDFQAYQKVQEYVLDKICSDDISYVLDSAKYLGRFFALRNIFHKRVKGIFLLRDVRGVIWSFKKKVQTQSPPVRTIIYYWGINFLGQVLVWFLPKSDIIKIRYEDIIAHPGRTVSAIGNFLDIDFTETVEKIERKESFLIPHIIGGNRLKKKESITLNNDSEWVKKMSLLEKLGYYVLTFPLMVFNKYSVLK